MIIIIIKGRQGRVVGPKRKTNVIERIDVNQRTTQKKTTSAKKNLNEFIGTSTTQKD